MSYFAFAIEEVKSIIVNIEAENEQEAYERLFDVMNNSDVVDDTMSDAVPYDYDVMPMLSTRNCNVDKTLSDGDYKRIMGE